MGRAVAVADAVIRVAGRMDNLYVAPQKLARGRVEKHVGGNRLRQIWFHELVATQFGVETPGHLGERLIHLVAMAQAVMRDSAQLTYLLKIYGAPRVVEEDVSPRALQQIGVNGQDAELLLLGRPPQVGIETPHHSNSSARKSGPLMAAAQRMRIPGAHGDWMGEAGNGAPVRARSLGEPLLRRLVIGDEGDVHRLVAAGDQGLVAVRVIPFLHSLLVGKFQEDEHLPVVLAGENLYEFSAQHELAPDGGDDREPLFGVVVESFFVLDGDVSDHECAHVHSFRKWGRPPGSGSGRATRQMKQGFHAADIAASLISPSQLAFAGMEGKTLMNPSECLKVS